MASINLQPGNYIIFQLLRKNLAGNDDSSRAWQEIDVMTLAVNPSYIDYNYRNRSQVNQTQERKGFVDKFGMMFTQVDMGGTFGSKARRVGLSLQDGYTRLINFRDGMVKKSNRVNDELDNKESQSILFGGSADANARYVYAVNFYDFINNEMFAIDISTFNIRLDSAFNTVLPTYKLAFQEIGDIIKVSTKDGVLRAALAVSSVMSTAQNIINDALSYIGSNSLFQDAAFGVSLFDDTTSQVGLLTGVTSEYSSAITTIAAATGSKTVSGNAIQLSSVKG